MGLWVRRPNQQGIRIAPTRSDKTRSLFASDTARCHLTRSVLLVVMSLQYVLGPGVFVVLSFFGFLTHRCLSFFSLSFKELFYLSSVALNFDSCERGRAVLHVSCHNFSISECEAFKTHHTLCTGRLFARISDVLHVCHWPPKVNNATNLL